MPSQLRDAELEDSPAADDDQEEGSKPMSKVVEVKVQSHPLFQHMHD